MICNTRYQHKDCNKWTWTSPDGKYKNMIDLILIERVGKPQSGITGLTTAQFDYVRRMRINRGVRKPAPKINRNSLWDRLQRETFKLQTNSNEMPSTLSGRQIG